MAAKHQPLELADAMQITEFMRDQGVQNFAFADLRVSFFAPKRTDVDDDDWEPEEGSDGTE